MQTLVFAVIMVFGLESGSKISRLGGLVFKAFAGVAAYRCSYRDSYRVGGWAVASSPPCGGVGGRSE